MTYRSLAELEDAQDDERRAARMRIEAAEQYIGHYRSRIDQVREAFYRLGAHEGVGDDPGFRQELQRVSDAAGENVAYAGRRIGELEEEYDAMLREHDELRDRFLADRNNTD
ncbi:hypothetical protein ACFRFH_04385 [Leifsonia sp. NPDC056824]|uniref:hypothetical protein n=1 Tax=Leifsonia sp. NPDC056824 TaxID=3345953 RepID=UPI0036C87104